MPEGEEQVNQRAEAGSPKSAIVTYAWGREP